MEYVFTIFYSHCLPMFTHCNCNNTWDVKSKEGPCLSLSYVIVQGNS